MMHRVVANLVTIVMDAAHQARIQVCPVTRDKKGRVDMVLSQDIKYA